MDSIDKNIKNYIKYLKNIAPVAINGSSKLITLRRTIYFGICKKISKEIVLKYLLKYWNPRCVPPFDEEEIEHNIDLICKSMKDRTVLNDLIDWHSDKKLIDNTGFKIRMNWDAGGVNNFGKPKSNLTNTVNYFLYTRLHKKIRYNQMTNHIEFTGEPPWKKGNEPSRIGTSWNEIDSNYCKYYFSSSDGYEVKKDLIQESALICASHVQSYHPIKDWIKSLEWDGTSRLDNWLIKTCQLNDNEYTRQVSRKILVAAVNRIFEPGCKFDYMMVLEGEEGCGKSTLIKEIAGDYYASIPLDATVKDTVVNIQGKWIVEIEEMSYGNTKDYDSIKAFITRSSDRIRLPYGRDSIDLERSCIFMGSVNPKAKSYMLESSGSRRFWPIKTPCTEKNKIDNKWIKKNRDQLFAEAYQLFLKNEKIYLTTSKAVDLAKNEIKIRNLEDPMKQEIIDFLQGKNYIQLRELWHDCLKFNRRMTSKERDRISDIMLNDMKWDRGYFYSKNTQKTCPGFYNPKKQLDIKIKILH